MLGTFLKKVEQIFIKPIEDSAVPWEYFLLLAYIYTVMRNILESAFGALRFLGFTPLTLVGIEETFLHFPLFYFVIYLGVIISLSLILKREPVKIAKLVFFYSFIILIPPLADVCFRGAGYRLLYPWRIETIPYILGYLFGIVKSPLYGLSPGMRIEVIVAILCIAFYLLIRSKSIVKILLGVTGCIIAIGFAGVPQGLIVYLAYWLGIIPKLSYDLVYFEGGLITSSSRKWALLLLSIFLLLLLAFLYFNTRISKKLLKKSINLKCLLYGVAGLFGFFSGWWLFKDILVGTFKNPYDYLLTLSIFLTAFLIGILETSIKEKKKQSWLPRAFLILSFLFSWCNGYAFLYLYILLISILFLRYLPPLMLERFKLLRPVLSSLSVLLIVIMGFTPFGQESSISVFPALLAAIVFVITFVIFTFYEILYAEKKPAIY